LSKPFSQGALFFSSIFFWAIAKENEQLSSNICSAKTVCNASSEKRSFLCLDTKERTKGKIKAEEKMA
jgi:hypothetical protein